MHPPPSARPRLAMIRCLLLCSLVVAGLLGLARPVRAQAPAAPPAAAATALPGAATPPAAAAAAPAPLAESLTGPAKESYDAAVVLFNDGDARGALLKFGAAYEAARDPRLLWNMAVCEKQQRHYARMIGLLERYLAEGGAVLTESERTEARAVLETLQPFVSRVALTVSEPSATVYLDGELVGQSPLPELVVDMGPRELRVQKEGFVDWRWAEEVQGGSRYQLEAKLVAERHVGMLRIVTDVTGDIRIDGKLVGRGRWQGELSSGTHGVDVTSPGMELYQADVLVQDDQLTTVRVNLRPLPRADEDERKPLLPVWVWAAGGAVLATGLGVGGYFLARDREPLEGEPIEGTMDPGWIRMPLTFGGGGRP